MRETLYLCDFNANLPKHQAHISVECAGTAKGSFDLCADHLCQALTALLLRSEVTNITLHKLTEDFPQPQSTSNGHKQHPKSPCPLCGEPVSLLGLSRHVGARHPDIDYDTVREEYVK